MALAVFNETLRRHWRAILWWGIGISLLGGSQFLVLEDSESLQQIAQLMESMPPFFVQMFGGGDVEYMVSPEGYVASNFFSLGLIIFAFYAVIAGLNVIANEEDRGQTDLLLSLPVTRTRLVVEKSAAFALIIVGIAAVVFLGLILSISATGVLEVRTSRVLESTINILPGSLFVLAFTVMISGLIGNRPLALGITAGFVAVSYFLDTLASLAPDSIMGTLRALSFFRYYDGVFTMRDGLNLGNIAVLLAASAILFAAGLRFFNRRDVAV
ncbi:MAG: ABC transporter permease subunit [Anaerolineae bacterium]|nr:ABC transporter permease subunit [Anaerolineae bacterium]